MLWDIIRLDLLFCVLNGQRTLVIYIIRSYIMLACICACDFVCIFVCLNNFAIDLHWKIAETFKMCMLLHIHSNYSSNKNTGNISEKSEIKLSLCMCVLFFSFASSVLLLLLYFIQFLFENVNLFFLSLCVHAIRYLQSVHLNACDSHNFGFRIYSSDVYVCVFMQRDHRTQPGLQWRISRIVRISI